MQRSESVKGTEISPRETASRLEAELVARLRRQEDAETAIEVYRLANWIVGRLDQVKNAALCLAEQDMRQRGLDHLDTPVGSAGWTEPKARQLDEEAWAEAIAKHPRLREIQREYEEARAALERVQESYKKLPESRFYLR